jgi:hypothetical protein
MTNAWSTLQGSLLNGQPFPTPSNSAGVSLAEMLTGGNADKLNP